MRGSIKQKYFILCKKNEYKAKKFAIRKINVLCICEFENENNLGRKRLVMNVTLILEIVGTVLTVAFIILSIIAIKTKKKTVYADLPKEKNPLEGKKVIFVENEEDNENADGKRGHLEVIGETIYYSGIYDKYIKRAIDIALSFFCLILMSPVFAIIAIVIKIEDPGPALFTQKRIGKNKQYFKLHKFRTMKVATPHDVPTHMLENPDQYITRVGKFLRSHSLDELPQIWDIFIGVLSFIGPRPGLWNQDILTAERDKYGANNVKPGLTGWAQINGRDKLEIPDKARLDGEYVAKMSFIMDIKVFFRSFHVFGKDDSVVEGRTGKLKISNNDLSIKKEKFSVLMSVYEKENQEFFDLSLKSNLENQTRKPDEFVLVCDGPLTSELNQIVAKYQKKFPNIVRVYQLKQNQGLGKALNFGLSKCSYDIVLRSDSDDICVDNRFEIQVKYMELHPEIAVCSSYIDEFDLDWTKPEKIKTLPVENDRLYKMAKFRNPINHMASAFRKTIILKVGSYHNLPYVEDYELWVRTLVNGYHMANIDKVLVHARIGNGMITRRGNRQYISSWKKLNKYMLQSSMINFFEYHRNIVAVRVFIYMPPIIKRAMYNIVLRKSSFCSLRKSEDKYGAS